MEHDADSERVVFDGLARKPHRLVELSERLREMAKRLREEADLIDAMSDAVAEQLSLLARQN